MQSNITPESADLAKLSNNIESPVKPAYAPEITPQMAQKNLGNKFPYSGGAMATHSPSAMQVGTHSYTSKPAGQEGAHIMHPPRTV